jgi:hypothetical protein
VVLAAPRTVVLAAAIGGLACGLAAADLVDRGSRVGLVVIVCTMLVGALGTTLGYLLSRCYDRTRADGSGAATPPPTTSQPPSEAVAAGPLLRAAPSGPAVPGAGSAPRADQMMELGGVIVAEPERHRPFTIARSGQPRTYDISAILRPLIGLARARGQRIAVSLPAKAPAFGRPQAVSQIIGNLLQNTARHAPGAPVDIVVTTTPTSVSITVGNTLGAGHRAGGAVAPGSGLGLELCRRIARAERGVLVCRSTAKRYETTLIVPAAGVLTVRRPPIRRRPGLSEV